MTRKILGVGYYPITGVDSLRFVESIHRDVEGNWKLILTKDSNKVKVFGDEITFIYTDLVKVTYYCEPDQPGDTLPDNTHVLLVLDKV